jgi:hypothetical protein
VFKWLRLVRGPHGLRKHLGDTVTVHTTDGHSISGVVRGDYRSCIVLTAAVHLGDQNIELGGDVILPSANFSWAQTSPPRKVVGADV